MKLLNLYTCCWSCWNGFECQQENPHPTRKDPTVTTYTTAPVPPRSLQELAREALDVQNACNLANVSHRFSRAMVDLCSHVPNTAERNTHPIALLWADKIAHLTRTQVFDGPSRDTIGEAYRWARRVSEGGEP